MGHPFDLVIFDCDGVLVDSERLVLDIDAEVLSELGWTIDRAEVTARFMGKTHESMIAEVAERIGAERAAEYVRISSERIRAAFEADLVPVAGAPEFVAADRGRRDRNLRRLQREPREDGFDPPPDRTVGRFSRVGSSPRRRSPTASLRRTCSSSQLRRWASLPTVAR